MTGISAALIVKDEEPHIGACLRSIAGIVDEVVVVNTGSRDRSREIAVAHGARVIDYQWPDDFAAARNHAIDHASGDWIPSLRGAARRRGNLGGPSAIGTRLLRFARNDGVGRLKVLFRGSATRPVWKPQ